MNSTVKKVFDVLFGRIARNVYFWILMVYVALNNNIPEYKYPANVYHQYISFTLLLLGIYTYINNLWLLPRFLAKKRIKQYVVFDALLTLIIAIIYVVVVKTAKTHYPLIETHHISLLTSPVGTEWNAGAFFTETLWFGLGLLLWQLLLSMAWFANQYSRREKEAELYKRKHSEAKLAFLRNQVNPHFLFNTLNNIYGLTIQKKDEAPEAILKLSSFMRYLLNEGIKEKVSSEKEIEAMQSYIDLEMLRLSDKSKFSFSIYTDKDYIIPGLLWLPILENAFKHGTRIISDEIYIDYRFSIKEGIIKISSSNFYKAGADSGKPDSGIGLANLRKRLDLLYHKNYNLDIENAGNKYEIDLQLQLT
jgi:two-component system, LytTR family, sensor kinase